jgi:hypothetical protein
MSDPPWSGRRPAAVVRLASSPHERSDMRGSEKKVPDVASLIRATLALVMLVGYVDRKRVRKIRGRQAAAELHLGMATLPSLQYFHVTFADHIKSLHQSLDVTQLIKSIVDLCIRHQFNPPVALPLIAP